MQWFWCGNGFLNKPALCRKVFITSFDEEYLKKKKIGLGVEKEGQNILSASQAIVVFGRNDSAGTVFWFCFSGPPPPLFKASDPFFLFISCIREETERGWVQSQENYGDRGHWEETAPGEDLET